MLHPLPFRREAGATTVQPVHSTVQRIIGLFAGGGETFAKRVPTQRCGPKHSGSGGEDLLALRSDVPCRASPA